MTHDKAVISITHRFATLGLDRVCVALKEVHLTRIFSLSRLWFDKKETRVLSFQSKIPRVLVRNPIELTSFRVKFMQFKHRFYEKTQMKFSGAFRFIYYRPAEVLPMQIFWLIYLILAYLSLVYIVT